MPDHAPATHLTYNLRLTRNTAAETWRITLYDAQTGSTLRFSSPAQLGAFLRIVMRTDVSEATEEEDEG